MIDDRTPVIVGAGQYNGRDHGSEPIELMTRCVEAALADAAAPALRESISAVRVVWGVWPYADPGRLVAERIGAPAARTTLTAMGGNQVYDLVNDTAARIRRGELDVAVMCAAETLRTRRQDHAQGRSDVVRARSGGRCTGRDPRRRDKPLSTATEHSLGLDTAVNFYAMAETAIRHRNGETVEAHRARIACAVGRWQCRRRGQSRCVDPPRPLRPTRSPPRPRPNRPIASPYPKLMTANLNVDQGGAVVMCSATTAARLGVATDRWVFPWSGSGAADHWYPTNRWAFDESPAMRLAGQRALDLAGASASTTVPCSTCTRASRRRCRSRNARSGSHQIGGGRSPAG